MPSPSLFAAEATFVPEQFFAGRTRGHGFFQDSLGVIRREFAVDIEGSVSEGVLTLNEQFLYDDGETEERSWQIWRNQDGSYAGRTADVPGVAQGRLEGRHLTWSYDFVLRMGPGRSIRVHFDDLMVGQGPGTMVNRARMSKFGVPLGTVFLCFRKLSGEGDEDAQSMASP